MYFKPFRQDPNRYADSQDFLDMSVFYNMNEWLQFRFQALNLTDEPKVMYRPTTDSLAQADYSGRKYIIGVRVQF
jgi:outer membrane receptor protein involved in Fe transport